MFHSFIENDVVGRAGLFDGRGASSTSITPRPGSARVCNLLGRDVENGELPNDEALLGTMIRNICHANTPAHLSLPDLLGETAVEKFLSVGELIPW